MSNFKDWFEKSGIHPEYRKVAKTCWDAGYAAAGMRDNTYQRTKLPEFESQEEREVYLKEWFKRRVPEFPFLAQSSINVHPFKNHCIRVPFMSKGVAWWGFHDEETRDKFVSNVETAFVLDQSFVQ